MATTTATTYTKAACPYCEWTGASHRTPHHIVRCHLDKIHLRPVQSDHCIFAYVLHKKEERGFCYCLTCHKGTYDSGYSANSSRWITMHQKQKVCQDAHPAALHAFKENSKASVIPPDDTPPTVSAATQFAELWEECKSKKALQVGMNKMEERLRQEYEADSDNEYEYKFSANDAMRYAITCAVAFEKETDKMKMIMKQRDNEYKKELCDLRMELQATKAKCDNLQENYIALSNTNNELMQKYNALIAAK